MKHFPQKYDIVAAGRMCGITQPRDYQGAEVFIRAAPKDSPHEKSPWYPPRPMPPAPEQAQTVDERKTAEQEYAITAFDYVKNPVGSGEWCLYWKGWQARAALAKGGA